ncbi:hypothetical protein C8Q80DRAFT_905102 [Daedaleopsis nitida]|nr:hypothetical protein C8Q80DRAFT_905102 [Daedaleopsis nitida]
MPQENTRKRMRQGRTKAAAADVSASSVAQGSLGPPPMAAGSGSSENGMVHDSEFWLGDGTITLTAQDVAFKVHKGPLLEMSPVFGDMLSFPQPEDAQVHSCPIVALPDSPHDLRHLLRALMPNKTSNKNNRFGTELGTFAAATACVRLGHKYQIDPLVEEALKSLRKLYPSDFDSFRRTHDRAPPPTSAIAVVNIARLTGADYLLPVALAECCRLGAAIVHGFLREDGTREHLSAFDLGLCFQAKEKLIEARVEAVARVFSPDILDEDDENCQADGMDASDVPDFFWTLANGSVSGLCTPHVWESVMPLLRRSMPDVCVKCKKVLRDEELHQQRRIFQHLPALVGVVVDGWGLIPQAQHRGHGNNGKNKDGKGKSSGTRRIGHTS